MNTQVKIKNKCAEGINRFIIVLCTVVVVACSVTTMSAQSMGPGQAQLVAELEGSDTTQISIKNLPDLPESLTPSVKTLSRPQGRESVGLVLSGGGAKGIAHVGVIQALEENDIPIDYVTGTSMGAIVGSLYSCGWSPEKMLEFFTAPDFLDWASGTINPDHLYYYYQPTPTPEWLSVNVNFAKKTSLPTQIIPSSLISPLPMNIEFLNLFGPYSEQCDENFNKLFVPFRCVASDVYHKHKVVFGEGSLGEAVRASMSFPMVFRPIEVNGILLYDGGIYDNFPVNVMEEDFDPDFIIGVSVSGADTKPISGDMYSQLEDMIIQNNDYSLPAKEGVKIQVPVLQFGVLQFDKARTIYKIGYETGLSMVDSIKSRLPSRVSREEVTRRREEFASKTPVLQFDSIRIEGVTGSQARYLRYLFDGGKRGTFGMEKTIDAYYRAVTDGSLSNLVPEVKFGRDNENNILLLKATPRRPWTLGIGGFVTTSTNSMLYFSGSYHTLGHNSFEASANLWLGQAYQAGQLYGRFDIRNRIPSYFELMAVFSRQKYFESELPFFKNSSPMSITEIDNFVRGGYVWAMGRKMKGYANLSWGIMSDSYFALESSTRSGGKDRIQYRIGLLRMGVEENSLDNQMYPSEGRQWYANVDLSWQWSRFKGSGEPGGEWKNEPVGSIEILWRKFFALDKHWRLGVMADGYATLRKLNQNYTNTLVHAPAFAPTPSTQNYFNTAFRSDNFLAVGLVPIWMPFSRFQVRGDLYVYTPVRTLRDNGRDATASYGKWFSKAEYIGELAVIYNLPFASLSVYGNYLSAPSRNWNVGISIGLFFQAPKLLRR